MSEAETKEKETTQNEDVQEESGGLMGTADEVVEETPSKAEDAEVDAKAEESAEETDGELLAGKFKTVEELEKGYLNAQKAISARGAPKEFNLPSELPIEIKDEDPLLEEFKSTAKQAGLSQKQFESLVQWHAKGIKETHDRTTAAIQEELGKLGKNAKNRITGVKTFLKDKLSDDQYTALNAALNTAEQVAAVEKLIDLAKGTTATPASTRATPQTIKAMENQLDNLNRQKHKDKAEGTFNPELQDKIETLAKKIAKAEGS